VLLKLLVRGSAADEVTKTKLVGDASTISHIVREVNHLTQCLLVLVFIPGTTVRAEQPVCNHRHRTDITEVQVRTESPRTTEVALKFPRTSVKRFTLQSNPGKTVAFGYVLRTAAGTIADTGSAL